MCVRLLCVFVFVPNVREREVSLSCSLFRACACVCVCAPRAQACESRQGERAVGAVRLRCRYHPSPCHRPRGCWESGRRLRGSDNRGCILIFWLLEEKPARLLLPRRPARKPLTPQTRNKARSSGQGRCRRRRCCCSR